MGRSVAHRVEVGGVAVFHGSRGEAFGFAKIAAKQGAEVVVKNDRSGQVVKVFKSFDNAHLSKTEDAHG